jgi:hypothetical protein
VIERPSRRIAASAVLGLVALVILIPVGRWQRDRAISAAGRTMSTLVAIAGPNLRSHLSGSRPDETFDCLLYSVGTNRTAVELCFSPDGHLVESIDRRGATPSFLSFRDEPSASPVKVALPILIARFHDTGTFKDVPVDAASLPVGFPDSSPVMIPAAELKKLG